MFKIKIIKMKGVLSILVFLVTFSSLLAQETSDKNPILTDKIFVRPGWYFPVRDLQLGVEGNVGGDRINDIDFDETLKLDKGENSFNLDFTWRFSNNNKWSLSGEYFKVGNKRSVTLDEEVEWDDVIYPVGGDVKASYSVALYRIFFARVISTGQKHELSGGLGVHGLNVKGSLEGEAFAGEQTTEYKKKKAEAFLPMPNIGFWYIWTPSNKWALSAKLDWFGIKMDNISGGLWNLSPGVTYQIIDNLGINANYQFLNFNADIDSDGWNGGFDLSFSGPAIRIVGNF